MVHELFQTLLMRTAIITSGCDGSIDQSEIEEIKNIAQTEIYFMGFDYSTHLERQLLVMQNAGLEEIKSYLDELGEININNGPYRFKRHVCLVS